MVRMFEGDDTEEVVGLARELLPASMTAVATIAALTGEAPQEQTRQIVEAAGRLSRDMARTYLEEAALLRGSFDDTPPYGCRKSVDQKAGTGRIHKLK